MVADMANESLQQPPQPQHGERLARLEGAYPHLATRADLERLQSTLIKWIVGTGIALFVALLAAANLFLPLS
ncbi:MAG: hypothetical protein OXI77_05025 [Chloroflexota bacterium]|nr:hypothetical protein [Chloroflexota bacterium]MDE2909880.1 hypothetical protein [Chloroflexota bacterium]